MSTASSLEQIGETAGIVWQTLSENGPMPLSKLLKSIAAPRDTVMQAIGWLAREDKIAIDGASRSRTIALR